ncbi:MAG: hypothetical protein LC632_05815 [Xanthomonadaceae bacterium]|nr:hypothetical protein [Xanthomonadaceae bacterium]
MGSNPTLSAISKRVLLSFVGAVLVATALGSIVQTQFNLAAISGLGVDISLGTRLATTLHDLGMFTPVFGTIVFATLLVALPLAALLARLMPALTGILFFAAGAVGIWVSFQLIDALLPMPTFIGATRSTVGTLTMMLAVGFATWVFARIALRPGR